MEFSKNISRTQIIKRWIWSRLCGFPRFCIPGDARSLNCQQLYKRALYYYNIKPYTVRRAAESLGVYPDKNVAYKNSPELMKPYKKGWRLNQWSWASIRNPVWIGNKGNWGKGYCNWALGAPKGLLPHERDNFVSNVECNILSWMQTNGPDTREFLFPRPELFINGYTENSIDSVIRNVFINNFVFLIKIDDEDKDGSDVFESYDIEQLYGMVVNELALTGRDCSRERFRIASYGLGFTSEDKGRVRRSHGLRPFLDAIDQLKLSILERIEAKVIPTPFDMTSLWKACQIDNVSEKLMYDAAVSELVYEGLLKTAEFMAFENNQGLYIDIYDEEPTGKAINKRLLYLDSLNSERRKFAKQMAPLYCGNIERGNYGI